MQSSKESAIKLEGLTKKYGERTVLDNISLTITKGLTFGLLGPNGAGKSSMINIISGISKQTMGEVYVMGKNIKNHIDECKMKIGTVVQEVMLDPFFSVFDYLIFMAGYYGIPRSKAKSRIQEVCEALSLTEHLYKNTRMLSGGMKRRLLIAKAILHDPEIIILDEPTAGVDIELRTSLWDYMGQLKNQGKTIILTTHYLEEAQSFCDKIAFINKGKIIANDTTNNILHKTGLKTAIFQVDRIEAFDQPKSCTINFNRQLNTVEVEYSPNVFQISSILSIFKELNINVMDVTTKEVTLDDIFLSIFHNNYAKAVNI